MLFKTGFALVLSCCLLLLSFGSVSALSDKETNEILNSCEAVFKAMKDSNYKKVWYMITPESKETIIKDTYKELDKAGVITSRDNITADFEGCGSVCRSYWKGFLKSFKPDAALMDSKWAMGDVDGKEAEIIITYKKAQQPARVKMFKIDGLWKMGLTETFWTRKSLFFW